MILDNAVLKKYNPNSAKKLNKPYDKQTTN